jgi:hypothetical protein
MRHGFGSWISRKNIATVMHMARPPKDPHLRMNIDLRIPVTSEQKRLISQAMADHPAGFAAWARDLLLTAAAERIRNRKSADKHGGRRHVS